jgi:hypothetical protein
MKMVYNIFNKLLNMEINHNKGVVIRPIWAYNNTFGEHINELVAIRKNRYCPLK